MPPSARVPVSSHSTSAEAEAFLRRWSADFYENTVIARDLRLVFAELDRARQERDDRTLTGRKFLHAVAENLALRDAAQRVIVDGPCETHTPGERQRWEKLRDVLELQEGEPAESVRVVVLGYALQQIVGTREVARIHEIATAALTEAAL